MSASKSKQQPNTNKKQQPIKQAPKEWKAEDYISSNATIEQVRDVKSAFDIFDTDRSGIVDTVELKQAFVSLGLAHSNKYVYNLLNSMGVDHPEGLYFAEFLKLATGKLQQSLSRKEIQTVFSSFDQQNTGKIDAHKFKQVALQLGQDLTDEQIEKIFVKTDLDGDGYITSEDFYTIMTQNKYQE